MCTSFRMDDRRVLATFKIALVMFTLCTFAVAIFALATFVYLWIFWCTKLLLLVGQKYRNPLPVPPSSIQRKKHITALATFWGGWNCSLKMENVKMQSLLDPTSKANCSSTEWKFASCDIFHREMYFMRIMTIAEDYIHISSLKSLTENNFKVRGKISTEYSGQRWMNPTIGVVSTLAGPPGALNRNFLKELEKVRNL